MHCSRALRGLEGVLAALPVNQINQTSVGNLRWACRKLEHSLEPELCSALSAEDEAQAESVAISGKLKAVAGVRDAQIALD